LNNHFTTLFVFKHKIIAAILPQNSVAAFYLCGLKEQYKRIKATPFPLNSLRTQRNLLRRRIKRAQKKKIEDNCLNNLSSILVRPLE
jgi:hypothetical protein